MDLALHHRALVESFPFAHLSQYFQALDHPANAICPSAVDSQGGLSIRRYTPEVSERILSCHGMREYGTRFLVENAELLVEVND